MNWTEAAGTILGLWCVWLTIRQHILCWPVGLVQVIIYVFVFYEAKLYSDLMLQVYYIVTQLYGWHYWLHGGRNCAEAPVTCTPPRALVLWILAGCAGTAAWGWGMSRWTDAAAPYPDAFVAVMSLIAQWLMARKELESWFFWIAVDFVAVGVYCYKHLYLTTGLYAVFLAMAVAGWLAWRRTMAAPRAAEFPQPAEGA